MFNDWLDGYERNFKSKVLVGMVAMCFIQLSKNGLVFDEYPMKTYMQVLYRGTHWCRLWMQLQKHEDTTMMKEACRSLKMMVMQIFTSHGWSFRNRIVF